MRFALAATLSLSLLAVQACSSANQEPPPAEPRTTPTFLVADARGLSFLWHEAGLTTPAVRYNDASILFDPAVSPDGRTIAFIRQPPPRTLPDGSSEFGSDLYVANRDGRDPRMVLAHSRHAEYITSPSWINDEEVLVSIRGQTDRGRPDIRIERINLVTGARTLWLRDGVMASVSPDGKAVVYVHIDPDTETASLVWSGIDSARRRTLVQEGRLSSFFSPVFSPDGETVAFAAMEVSTTAPSTDSERLRAFAAHPGAHDIWLVKSDGGGLKRIGDIADARPSVTYTHDGSAIFALGQGGMWRIDARSGEVSKLAQVKLSLGQAVWLRD